MSDITKQFEQKVAEVKTLADIKTLYTDTPSEHQYELMRIMKFRVMEIMEVELEKGVMTEGQYLEQCNRLRDIYP